MLWPAREDAKEYLRQQGHAADCTVDYVDMFLFLHLTEAAPNSDVQIFPTEKDAISMSGKALQKALEEELENSTDHWSRTILTKYIPALLTGGRDVI